MFRSSRFVAPAIAAAAVAALVVLPTTAASAADDDGGSSDVSARGYVTSEYSWNGVNVFYLQRAGSGGKVASDGSSDAVLVLGTPDGLSVGDFVEVEGAAGEAWGTRVLGAKKIARVSPGDSERDKPRPVESVGGVPIAEALQDDALRQRIDGMTVSLGGDWTVSRVDQAAARGEVAIVPGDAPLATTNGTDVPAARLILDDGRADQYDKASSDRAPWLGDGSPRVGSRVDVHDSTFVVQHADGIDGVSNGWHLQPVHAFDATTKQDDRAYSFRTNELASSLSIAAGDVAVASVDLGNYFPITGTLTATAGTTCSATSSLNGTALAVKGGGGCTQLGAASADAFDAQKSKVAALLSGLSTADVIAVQGVANPALDREASGAFDALADQLRASTGGAWRAVSAPGGVAGPWVNGFLYRSDRVSLEGDARVITADAFVRSSAPLVQSFTRAVADAGSVTLVSTRLSSQAESDYDGDVDAARFAHANADDRAAGVRAVADWVHSSANASSTVVLGAFGSLTGDSALDPMNTGGTRDIVAASGLLTSHDADASGNLVHAYVSSALSTSSAVSWPVNSIAPRTAGYAYSGTALGAAVDIHSPVRASADDPFGFSLSLPRVAKPASGSSSNAETAVSQPSTDAGSTAPATGTATAVAAPAEAASAGAQTASPTAAQTTPQTGQTASTQPAAAVDAAASAGAAGAQASVSTALTPSFWEKGLATSTSGNDTAKGTGSLLKSPTVEAPAAPASDPTDTKATSESSTAAPVVTSPSSSATQEPAPAASPTSESTTPAQSSASAAPTVTAEQPQATASAAPVQPDSQRLTIAGSDPTTTTAEAASTQSSLLGGADVPLLVAILLAVGVIVGAFVATAAARARRS